MLSPHSMEEGGDQATGFVLQVESTHELYNCISLICLDYWRQLTFLKVMFQHEMVEATSIFHLLPLSVFSENWLTCSESKTVYRFALFLSPAVVPNPLISVTLDTAVFSRKHGLDKLYSGKQLLEGFGTAVPLPFHGWEVIVYQQYEIH